MRKSPLGQKKGVCTNKCYRWQMGICIKSYIPLLFGCNHCSFFPFLSVPSRPPSNATFTNVRATEITVHWNPLPKQYVNGRLSGYYVDYMFPLSLPDSIYPQYNKSSVTVNPNNTWVTLTGLKPQQLYYIQVAAFTSKGRGPSSESVTHKTGKSP